MGTLFDTKQELVTHEGRSQTPPRQIQPIQQTDPNAPRLSAGTQASLAGGGATGSAVRGIGNATAERLKSAVRDEFERLLMKQEKGVDEFVKSAVTKYGPEIVEYLPPKELFYDENGDFQAVKYYTHAMAGIKEYRPIDGKKKKSAQTNEAIRAYKEKTGQISPEAELALSTGGPKGGLEQIGAERKIEGEGLERKSKEKIAADKITSTEKEGAANRASRERIAAAKNEIDRLNKLDDEKKKNIKSSAVRKKGLDFDRQADMMDEKLQTTDKKKFPQLYEERKRLLKELRKTSTGYLALADAIETSGGSIPESQEDAALGSVREQAERKSKGEMVQSFKEGGFRGGILPFKTSDDKRRFEKAYMDKFGEEVQYDAADKPINPATGREIDVSEFLRSPEQSFAAPDRQGTPLQADTPKMAAARKALKDPNAPEKVKAQARIILGL